MAVGNAVVKSVCKSETNTLKNLRIDTIPRITVVLTKLSPLLVVPWIVFSISPNALYQQQFPLTISFVGMGIAAAFLKKKTLLAAAYTLLILLLVLGKTSTDLLRLPGPDTAIFLLQFVIVLFLYEVSGAALVFEPSYQNVKDRNDEFSTAAKFQILAWYKGQVQALGKMTLAALAVSLGLVVLGATLSVGFNQLAFAGILVIGSVIALLFLLTNSRESDNTR